MENIRWILVQTLKLKDKCIAQIVKVALLALSSTLCNQEVDTLGGPTYLIGEVIQKSCRRIDECASERKHRVVLISRY